MHLISLPRTGDKMSCSNGAEERNSKLVVVKNKRTSYTWELHVEAEEENIVFKSDNVTISPSQSICLKITAQNMFANLSSYKSIDIARKGTCYL